MPNKKHLGPENTTKLVQEDDYWVAEAFGLSPKERDFCVWMYSTKGHGAYSAKAAGYGGPNSTPQSLAVQANLLKKRPRVRKYLDYLEMDRQGVDYSEQWVVSKLIIISKDKKLPASARVRALEALAKIKGLMDSGTQSSAPVPILVKFSGKKVFEFGTKATGNKPTQVPAAGSAK